MKRVRLCGKLLTLRDKALLGQGGEARVYAHSGRAIKVYHPIPTGLETSARRAAQKQHDLRVAKLKAFPSGLPGTVVAPEALVYDDGGNDVIGYAMAQLQNAHDFVQLSRRSFRDAVISNQQLIGLFRELYLTLGALHRSKVIVGDLNDGNVVFFENPRTQAARSASGLAQQASPSFALKIIDADSMQFAGYPCVVAHERFVDPRLYGVDLSSRPRFDELSDWYAFATLLFNCLLYVHPYGGVHPDYPTLLRRAEAHVSVFAPEVTLPKVAAPLEVLSPTMRDYFGELFDSSQRSVFPESLLETGWRRCSCGLEHARSHCPACQASLMPRSTPSPAVNKSASLVIVGRCRALPLFATRGRLVAVCVRAGRLRYAALDTSQPGEQPNITREDGSKLFDTPIALLPGTRVAIADKNTTWIGYRGQLARVQKGAPPSSTRTASAFGEAVFDANESGCYRLQDDWLIRHEDGVRIGQLVGNQAWLRVGATLGYGFYRAGAMLVAFVFDLARPILRTLQLPPIAGHIRSVHAVSHRRQVLFSFVAELDGQQQGNQPAGSARLQGNQLAGSARLQGRQQHTLYLIDDSPRLLATRVGDPQTDRLLVNPRGYALFAGRLLTSTDEGLLSADIDTRSGQIVERHLFTDSKPFCSADAELHLASSGSVYLATTKQIMQLAPS
jgi:hypothetical protein